MKRKLPIRKNIRLENYDYSDGGGYFITVCAKDRKCLFGNVNKNCVKINCDENQVINIISSNPMYLDRTNDGVLRLISKLKSYGFSMLNILFDSNPYILNLEVFEIENYINGSFYRAESLMKAGGQ